MKTLHLLITGTLLWAGLSGPAQSASLLNDDVAVIIGNKTYVDEDIPEVSFAHNDAQAMRKFVEDVLNIRPENIIYLEDATQAKMETAFGRKGNHRGKAFQFVKPDVSNLYVFYSGHGIPGQYDKKSYLLPVDAEIETADINGYPTDVLYENLTQVDAKSITVFLDACFSGNSHGGSLIKRASGAQILAAPTTEKFQKGNITVLTAASKDQLASWDEESQHGLFTEYLLRALYGAADIDKDGDVKLDEVHAYLSQDMRYKARRTYNRDQIPTIIGNGNKILAKATDGSFPKRPDIEPRKPVIDLSAEKLIPVEQNMFAIKNANVRSEPDVRSKKIMVWPKGEPIHVAAKVANKPWYAIESGDEIIGYIFQDLLGEEKEIATDDENRSIRELKERLEKLEERTRLSSNEILPSPPQQNKKDETIIVERGSNATDLERPEPNWSFENDPYDQIEKTLKSMGAILARQSFIERVEEMNYETSFHYNWIRIDAERCTIRASISMRHDTRSNRSINLHDHQVQAPLWKDLRARKRKLRSENVKGELIQEIILYQYGPYSFKDKKDRRRFKAKAERLTSLCPQPRQATFDHAEQPDYRQPTPPPRRRPPPPRFGRPPPPQR